MQDSTIERSALGRVAKVGDLYDARSDRFCGLSIFNRPPPGDAITTTDSPHIQYETTIDESFSEKFSKLKVAAELKISVLGGLFSLSGSGEYLNDKKTSQRSSRMTLLYNITTKTDHLNLLYETLKNSISMEALNAENATHVVVEVQWGANFFMFMQDQNSKNRERTEVEGCLGAMLNKAVLSISGKAEVKFSESEEKMMKNFTMKMFGDVLPHKSAELAFSFSEVVSMIKKLPSLIQEANDGKGMPLHYILFPLSSKALTNHFKTSQLAHALVVRLEEAIITQFVRLFDDVIGCRQALNDLACDIKGHVNCVNRNDVLSARDLQTRLEVLESELRKALSDKLYGVRSGILPASELGTVYDKYTLQLQDLRSQHENLHVSLEKKLEFAKMCSQFGVHYVTLETELNRLVMQEKEIFVLYADEVSKTKRPDEWRSCQALFFSMLAKQLDRGNTSSMLESANAVFTYVDCDFFKIPDTTASTELLKIKHFRNRQCICTDVEAFRLLNYARRSQRVISIVDSIPDESFAFVVPCPGFWLYAGSCTMEKREWVCSYCRTPLKYCLANDSVYCECGREMVSQFKFKCCSELHADDDYLAFEEKTLRAVIRQFLPQHLKVADMAAAQQRVITVLILGEIGVGKSTWINGFANFLTYDTLAEAEVGPPVCLIPTSFTMTDENCEERIIKTGDDKNEDHRAGQSATQFPQTYVFECSGVKVRVIDTPGTGDVRGIDQDKKNMDCIMNHLANVDEINGICILLKPNNARLTVMFSLLAHLHRDASKNILFCFTNARGTFYQPGDTLPALRNLLEKDKDMGIKISRDTIFCIDNEAVRFLAAVQQGVVFSDNEKSNYATSWQTSVKEINRLMIQIASLEPHGVKNTVSLNSARRKIIALSRPLGAVTSTIQSNIDVIKDKEVEIRASKKTKDDLEKKLYIPGVDLKTVPLDHPRTVCTASRCVEYTTVGGYKKVNYIRHCHPHCGITGAQSNTTRCVALQQCEAMDGSFRCKVCGCSWDVHMLMTYECEKVTVTVKDVNVEKLIAEKTIDVGKKEAMLAELNQRVQLMEGEKRQMAAVGAKFACFLKMHAIAPYNDALGDYLYHLISAEKSKIGVGGDRKSLEGLESMRKMYDNEVEILEKAIEHRDASAELRAEDVNRLMKSLYDLKVSGKMLKNAVEVAELSVNNATRYTEHVVPPGPNATKKGRKCTWLDPRTW